MGTAATNGVHWSYSCRPVEGLEIEMDLRSTWQEVRLLGYTGCKYYAYVSTAAYIRTVADLRRWMRYHFE